MILPTRRFFIFGSAAAAAAAAAAAIPFPNATLVPALEPYELRRITGITISLLKSEHGFGFVDVFVQNEKIFHTGVAPGGWIDWFCLPGNEIILCQNKIMRIETTQGLGDIDLFCTDTLPNGAVKKLVERHRFGGHEPAQVIPLEM